MKKSVIITVVVCMFVASGVSYGATKNAAANASTANIEKMIDAGLEAAADRAAKDLDKAQWGNLLRHRKTILKEIQKKQSKYTEIVNLGKYATVPVVQAWGERVTDHKYLVSVAADAKVSYYNVVVKEVLILVEHKWTMQEYVHVYSMSKQEAEKAKQTIK